MEHEWDNIMKPEFGFCCCAYFRNGMVAAIWLKILMEGSFFMKWNMVLNMECGNINSAWTEVLLKFDLKTWIQFSWKMNICSHFSVTTLDIRNLENYLWFKWENRTRKSAGFFANSSTLRDYKTLTRFPPPTFHR